MRCVICPIRHVPNTIFCDECGAYLLQKKDLATEPLDVTKLRWLGGAASSSDDHQDLPNTRPLSVCLRILGGNQSRTVQLALAKPIRLGRSDPAQDIFPEVDLTEDRGREYGVSREHTCIFRQGNTVRVEDLASTNGTLLNSRRLDPYIPEILHDGDQLQIGRLLIEVSF
jgi:hypothetical protein